MRALISPSRLQGVITAIPSKSAAHRLFICAALADSPSEITLPNSSEDIDATIGCLKSLGAEIEKSGDRYLIRPATKKCIWPHLDCRESGSTFRFLLPVASAICGRASFTGAGRLPLRPISELLNVMSFGGVHFSSDRLPFNISGELQPGNYEITGSVSSQYISGLLMALPILGGDSRIILTSKLQSVSYVKMTLEALESFGIEIAEQENGFMIRGGQRFRSPGSLTVEGDWSNAAFFLAAGAISGDVTVSGLNISSAQGDKAATDILAAYGADISIKGDCVTVRNAPLHGITVDVSQVPDLLPVLAVTACFADGETIFTGAARLRIKESDRLSAVASMINSLGGEAKELEDSLVVRGKPITGGSADSFGDHRIAMSAAIASCGASRDITIENPMAVAKSYPSFYEDFVSLGGIAADMICLNKER